MFAPLYCPDNGSSNKPVNILFSLEFLKHLHNYTDKEILEQYYFNYQVNYAFGQRNLGGLSVCERTLYDFRKKVYEYTLAHPIDADLVFRQFDQLLAHFLGLTKINTKEQRTESSAIMPKIRRAGRLSLAFDVLNQAVRICPPEILPESLRQVLEPAFRTDLLCRSLASEVKNKLQFVLDLQQQLLDVIASFPEVAELPPVALVRRFLAEQTVFDPASKKRVAKKGKEIAPDSLQSAYDPDATYRRKGNKDHVGYAYNVTETCTEENPVQFVTDYAADKNVKTDPETLKERLPMIKERTGLTDLYEDGGFYSPEVQKLAQEQGVTMHYTNLTGRKPASEKLPLSAFTIENHQNVLACPQNQAPVHTFFNEGKDELIAWFAPHVCKECPCKEQCPVKIQKKKALLKINQKTLLAAEIRKELADPEFRREATSKRAAIEGTISAIKRGQGAGKLSVRGQIKCTLVMGFKTIAHNFQQLKKFFANKAREGKTAKIKASLSQGVSVLT